MSAQPAKWEHCVQWFVEIFCYMKAFVSAFKPLSWIMYVMFSFPPGQHKLCSIMRSETVKKLMLCIIVILSSLLLFIYFSPSLGNWACRLILNLPIEMCTGIWRSSSFIFWLLVLLVHDRQLNFPCRSSLLELVKLNLMVRFFVEKICWNQSVVCFKGDVMLNICLPYLVFW